MISLARVNLAITQGVPPYWYKSTAYSLPWDNSRMTFLPNCSIDIRALPVDNLDFPAGGTLMDNIRGNYLLI